MKGMLAIAVFFCMTFNARAQDSPFEIKCKEISKTNQIVKGMRIKTFSIYSKRLSMHKDARSVSIGLTDVKGEGLSLRYAIVDPSPTDNIFIDYIMRAKINNTILDVCYDNSSDIFAISDHYS